MAIGSLRMARLHKSLGVLLCLPIMVWVITGAVFFIKPGYTDAFDVLSVKRYPLTAAPFKQEPQSDWLEIKQLRTLLGEHLLVYTNGQWQQLHPATLAPLPPPPAPQLQALVQDALQQNPKRYGQLIQWQGLSGTTSTGVSIHLDWNTLNLSQSGQDTQLINILYKMHYLQWLPNSRLNSVLGALGLMLLAGLAVTGLWRFFKR